MYIVYTEGLENSKGVELFDFNFMKQTASLFNFRSEILGHGPELTLTHIGNFTNFATDLCNGFLKF